MSTSFNPFARLPTIEQLMHCCSWPSGLGSTGSLPDLTRWAQMGLLLATSASMGTLAMMAWEHWQPPSNVVQRHPALSAQPLDLERLRTTALFGKPVLTSQLSLPQVEVPNHSAWQLQAAFTSDATFGGSAILSDGQNPARMLRTSQTLPDGSKLVEVHRDHVVLQQPNGRTQQVRFPAPTRVASTSRPARDKASSQALLHTAQARQALPESSAKRRAIVRQRLETLRQRALSSG